MKVRPMDTFRSIPDISKDYKVSASLVSLRNSKEIRAE